MGGSSSRHPNRCSIYFSISATVLQVYSTTLHYGDTREGILFYSVPKHSYCALSRGGTSTRLHLWLRLPCTIELTCFLLMHIFYVVVTGRDVNSQRAILISLNIASVYVSRLFCRRYISDTGRRKRRVMTIWHWRYFKIIYFAKLKVLYGFFSSTVDILSTVIYILQRHSFALH